MENLGLTLNELWCLLAPYSRTKSMRPVCGNHSLAYPAHLALEEANLPLRVHYSLQYSTDSTGLTLAALQT